MPTCCSHGNCINIFLTTHSHLHSLHPIICPFFSFSRESPIIPEEKSINGCLNQWHLKSRWHGSFYGKAVSTNALAMWWKKGRIILALGKGWVHITMNNFGEKWECTLEIHRRLPEWSRTAPISVSHEHTVWWRLCSGGSSFPSNRSFGSHTEIILLIS